MFIDTTHPRCGDALVFLNGVLQMYAICADEEGGYIERHKTDKLGFSIANGEFVTEKLFGHVEVRFIDSKPRAGR